MSSGATHVEWALNVRNVSPSEKLVLITLSHYADRLKTCRPSVERLINETGLSRATIYRALTALEERNLIDRQVTAKTNIYTLHALIVRPQQSKARLTVRPKPLSSTTRATRTSYRKLLQPTVEGPSRPLNNKNPQSKTQVRVAPSSSDADRARRNQAKRVAHPPVVRGWGVLHEILASRSKPRTKPQEEPTVAMPGFEKDETPKKPTRGRVDDTTHLAVVGKIEEAPKPAKAKIRRKPYESKPVEQWTATDFYDYIVQRARKKTPYLQEQVQRGWALGDFAKWLKNGTPPEVIHQTIDSFFDDELNFRLTDSKLTIWQRYRVYFVHNQKSVLERHSSDSDWDDWEQPASNAAAIAWLMEGK